MWGVKVADMLQEQEAERHNAVVKMLNHNQNNSADKDLIEQPFVFGYAMLTEHNLRQ